MDLREQFLARFADTGKSVEEYRAEIEQLFDRHTQAYPVVTDAIDFSHFFELAEQYHGHVRYLEAGECPSDDVMGRSLPAPLAAQHSCPTPGVYLLGRLVAPGQIDVGDDP